MTHKQQLFDNFKLDIKKFLNWDFQDKFKSSLDGNKNCYNVSVSLSGFLLSWDRMRSSLKNIDNAQYNLDQVPDNAFDSIIGISSLIDFFINTDTKETSNSDLFINVMRLHGRSITFLEIMHQSNNILACITNFVSL
jgi:hypothetical protein